MACICQRRLRECGKGLTSTVHASTPTRKNAHWSALSSPSSLNGFLDVCDRPA